MGLRLPWSYPLVLLLVASCGSLAGTGEAKAPAEKKAFSGKRRAPGKGGRRGNAGNRPKHEWDANEDYYYYEKESLKKGAQGAVWGDDAFGKAADRSKAGELAGEEEWLREAKKRRREHKRDRTAKGVHMPFHSLFSPFDIEASLEQWVTTGATVIETKRVLMHPGGVADRLGFMFCKKSLPTSQFEVVIQFRMEGEGQANKDAGFAFWYVMENVSLIDTRALAVAPTFSEGMQQAGLNFVGSKGRFDGFGVVLTPNDDRKAGASTISYVTNDGSRDVRLADFPTFETADFRNTAEFAYVKITSNPEGITAEFSTKPAEGWTLMFREARNNPIKPGGYIGLTAWSGEDAKGASKVYVNNMDVKNLDSKAIREELKDTMKDFEGLDKEPTLDSEAAQEQHLRRLSKMLASYNQDSTKMSDVFIKQLEKQQVRARKLDEQIAELTRAFSLLVNHGEDNPVKAMADHIVGLRKLLVKDGAKHKEALDKVHQNIREVQDAKMQASNPAALTRLTEQTTAMETTVQTRSTQMSWLLLTFIGCVVIIGFLLFNRMQYYEKKHFL